MDNPGRQRPMPEAGESVSGPAAGQGRESLSVWHGRTWLVAVPLALTVIYAFIPCLNNGFVSWDDDQNFIDNPHFRGLGAAQVRWAWTTFWVGAYQPLAWILYGAQYAFCQLDPRGYHLTSLAFHVANAVVLYVLTLSLLIRGRADSSPTNPRILPMIAGLATALFMVHPLRVEAVAWVSGQMYLPCILFSMLAVLAYLRAFSVESWARWGWLVCCFVLFVIALLFHALPVSLPAVLLILDAYPLRRFGDGFRGRCVASALRVLSEKVPFAVASLFFLYLAVVAKPQSRMPVQHFNASEGITQACYAVWFYIVKTVLPLNLVAFYPLPIGLNWREFPYNLSILATLATTFVLFVFRRGWPGLLAAWLCYLVILAPNSGLIRISDQIAADRYSYMSMLGFVAVAAAGLAQLWIVCSRWRPGAIGTLTLGLVAVVVLTILTRNQCRTWRDGETLWTYALEHGTGSKHMAHSSLGNVFSHQGKYDAAAAHFIEALRLNPAYDKIYNNLGNILYKQGKRKEAMAHFTEALRLNPDYADAHFNLGVALQANGSDQGAETHYAEALRLRPDYTDAHINLGVVLLRQGKPDEAKAHLTEALRLRPGSAEAHNTLGTILAHEKKYAEAQAHFAKSIQQNPTNLEAQYNLGLVFSQLGRYGPAMARFSEAIRLQPNDPKAYNASAMILAACPDAKYRDGKQAVQLATRACELAKGQHPIILDTLAAAQAEAGDFAAAVSSQKRAIELLTDERQKDDYRARLVLYQLKKPFHRVSPEHRQTEARP